MNEHIIAKLQALKAAPGVQMHWQERIQEIIDELSAPPAPVMPVKPEPVAQPPVKEEASKSKGTTAAHVSPAKMKGKK